MARYFTADEIRLHNCADDCWVYIDQDVYDLSALMKANRSALTEPILKYAGKSVSHWFISGTKELKTFIDPVRNIRVPYTPEGRFLHVPPSDPTADWGTRFDEPWWKDEKYIIGKLSKNTRLVRVLNMLTRSEDVITVCEEETIAQLQERFLEYNSNSRSYTWKALVNNQFVPLDMSRTLEENDIKDESGELGRLGLDEEFFVPTLYIYFNDDLSG